VSCDLWVRMLTYTWTHICLQDRICDSRWCSLYPSYCEGDIDLRGTTSSPKNNDTTTKERAGDGHHIWAWSWKVDHTSYIFHVFASLLLFLQGSLILCVQRCQDTIIGGSFIRGVSGGERKRVCIGNEILINPSLLFLDEPTSGLDSTTALRIVQLLHDIAEVMWK